jgi:YidC/Oxa1 family membrane protein insertase
LPAALEAYGRASARDRQGPRAADALLRTGDLAMKLNRPDQAVNAYKAVLHLPGERTFEVRGREVDAKEEAAARLPEAISAADKVHSGKISYKALDFLVAMTGRNPHISYALALFIFTLVVKLLLTPLTKVQFRYMRQMSRLQPMIREIQERYGDRKEEMNRRMMALYKEQGVNPLGCGFNTFIQMGIMILLYTVIRDYTYQFQNGFFLWINPTMAKAFPGVVGPNLSEPDLPLLILYAISMYASQKLTMIPAGDPQQMAQQKMMTLMLPVMFLFILRTFPSAFTLYWMIFNVLTTAQQYYMMHRPDPEQPVARGNTPPPPPPPAPRRGPRRRKR